MKKIYNIFVPFLGLFSIINLVLFFRETLYHFYGKESIIIFIFIISVLGLITGYKISNKLITQHNLLLFFIFVIGFILPLEFTLFLFIHNNNILLILTFLFINSGLLGTCYFQLFQTHMSSFYVYLGSVVGTFLITYANFSSLNLIVTSLIFSLLIIIVSIILSIKEKKGAFVLLFFFLAVAEFSFIVKYPSFLKSNYIEDFQGRIYINKNKPLTVYQNNLPIFSESDKYSLIYHFPFIQHCFSQRVLILSKTNPLFLKEFFSYPLIKKIYFSFYSPRVLDIVEKSINIPNDERIRILTTSVYSFIDSFPEDNYFDTIIIDSPLPKTLQFNRFYTIEFFLKIKRIIAPYGIIFLNINKDIIGNIGNTLKIYFPNIITVKYKNNISLLASLEKKLATSKTFLISQNKQYLKKRIKKLLPLSSFSFWKRNYKNLTVNSNLFPLPFHKWRKQLTLPCLLIFFVFGLLFIKSLKQNKDIFSFYTLVCGIIEGTILISTIYLFQSIFGEVYLYIGVLLGIFYLGSLFGDMLKSKYYLVDHIINFLFLFYLVIIVGLLILKSNILNEKIFIGTILFITGIFTSRKIYLLNQSDLKRIKNLFIIKNVGIGMGISLTGILLFNFAFIIMFIFICVFSLISTILFLNFCSNG